MSDGMYAAFPFAYPVDDMNLMDEVFEISELILLRK